MAVCGHTDVPSLNAEHPEQAEQGRTMRTDRGFRRILASGENVVNLEERGTVVVLVRFESSAPKSFSPEERVSQLKRGGVAVCKGTSASSQ